MESVARIGRGGWKDAEIRSLREAVETAGGSGEPLRGVFERVARALGRKPNSVRNYYYACLKRETDSGAPQAEPFELFTTDEVRALVREVLSARAQGISVRACVSRMADGDRKRMLRFQNKYRSVLKTRPALVREIISEMAEQGEPVFDPYAAQLAQPAPLYTGVAASIRRSGDPALIGLLRGLDALLARSGAMEPTNLAKACEPMIQCAKDFLGLPQEARAEALGGFCAELSTHIGEVENAMI